MTSKPSAPLPRVPTRLTGHLQPLALAQDVLCARRRACIRAECACLGMDIGTSSALTGRGIMPVRFHLYNRRPFLITDNPSVSVGFPTLKDVNNIGAVFAHLRFVLSLAMMLNYRAMREHSLSEPRYVGADLPFQIKPANPQIFPQIVYLRSGLGGVCLEYHLRRHHGLHDQDTSLVTVATSLSTFNVRGDMLLRRHNGEWSSETARHELWTGRRVSESESMWRRLIEEQISYFCYSLSI